MTNKQTIEVSRETIQNALNAVEYLALRADDIGTSNMPLAEELRTLLDQPAQEVKQQGVAIKLSDDVREFLKEWIESATGGEDADVDYDFASQLSILLGPLYTEQPAPVESGEVKRLEGLLTQALSRGADREVELSTQLAERDALLRKSKSLIKSAITCLEKFNEHKPQQWCGYLDDALGGLRYQVEHIDAALSASAEPKPAPAAVVLPERRALSPQSANFYARGFNACIDEFIKLNGLKP